MSTAIIQSLWVGKELSKLEYLSIKSFLAHDHEYHLYVYDNVKNLPEGVVVKDANTIIPADKVFVYQSGAEKGGFSGFSNHFRYKLLLKNGGWWVDTDVVCLKPFDIQGDIVVAGDKEPEGLFANNCIIKAPKGSQLMSQLDEEASSYNPAKIKFAQTGPVLLQKVIKNLGLESTVAPYYYFNPVSYKRFNNIVSRSYNYKYYLRKVLAPVLNDQLGAKVQAGSYALHMWSELWRRSGFDKNDTYHKHCLFEQMKKKYQVA